MATRTRRPRKIENKGISVAAQENGNLLSLGMDITVTPLTVLPSIPETVVFQVPSMVELAVLRDSAQATAREIELELSTLTVTDQESFALADRLFNKARTGGKEVDALFEPIIRPVRDGLDVFYELRREFKKPLEKFEGHIGGLMAAYELELKRVRDKEEVERLQREKELREAAAKVATNLPVYHSFPPHPAEVNILASSIPVFSVPEPVSYPVPAGTHIALRLPTSAPAPIASHSRTRFVQKWRIPSPENFVDFALSGFIPLDLLSPNMAALEELFLTDPEKFATLPGVELYDEAKISGR